MIRFSIDGVKHEFDDDHLSVVEVRDLKKFTGCSYREFWEGFGDMEADSVAGIVWLDRRRNGEPDLKFSDVDFDFMEFVSSMESDKAAETEGGTDGEADPTPPVEPDSDPETPST